MILWHLKLTNYRNYSNLDIELDGRPTILLGNNAAGKSNFLESIYLLSTTKSPRVEVESELIKKGGSFARVEGVAKEGEEETTLSVTILGESEGQSAGKRVTVNGVPRRVVDFIGQLPAVLFSPSDIGMVTGSPSLRRWQIDLGLAQIDREYKRALTLYEQFLTARNRVLKRVKEREAQPDELDYWTEELIKHGQVISAKRQQFFEFMNSLKGGLGNFRFEYKQSQIDKERLEHYRHREIAAASTLIGPHRDDFHFFEGDRNLAHFGSRGEQRIATLAFKLAQLEYMSQALGKRPILLLDDVFSELDATHRAYVVLMVHKQQTLMATVELENIPQSFLDQARILKVDQGRVAS